MAIGFAARIAVALTCDCHAYADEFMNYLEQAHRAVFGYGFIPWEYRFGVRSWLLPAIPMLPLWIAKTAGLDTPAFYVPFVNSFNALVSMAIPAGMYFFTRRAVSEKAARYALVFGTLWYELIVFAPRTLAEPYSTAAFFGALGLLSGKSGKKMFASGFLFGLAVSLRWHYGFAVAAVGLLWLISFGKNRDLLKGVAGGIAAISIWGLVDFLTWGKPFHSITEYLKIYPAFPHHLNQIELPAHPRYAEAAQLAASGFGLHLLSMAVGTIRWRKSFLPLSLVFLCLAIHAIPQSGEYRNVFIAIPLLWIVAASVFDSADGAIRVLFCCLFLSVSVAGFLGKLPKMSAALGDYTKYIDASTTPGISAAKELRKLPDGEIRGVLWLGGNQIFSGGYFYLHRNIPYYFAADPQNLQLVRNALKSGRKLNTMASHIVTPEANRKFAGFEFWTEVPDWEGWEIHRNPNPELVTPLSGYYYDTFDPNWVNIGNNAENLGIKTNPLPLKPYSPAAE